MFNFLKTIQPYFIILSKVLVRFAWVMPCALFLTGLIESFVFITTGLESFVGDLYPKIGIDLEHLVFIFVCCYMVFDFVRQVRKYKSDSASLGTRLVSVLRNVRQRNIVKYIAWLLWYYILMNFSIMWMALDMIGAKSYRESTSLIISLLVSTCCIVSLIAYVEIQKSVLK